MASIAIVIPCYKVANHIERVIASIPSDIKYIITVNDCSPDNTKSILSRIALYENRLIYMEHDVNKGVGGAMISGFKKALEYEVDIIIKLDGDGQMDSSLIPKLIKPLLMEKADFTKGNRFRNPKNIRNMPLIRRVGNLGLSFMTKAASGYWNIFDPTNGFIAITKDTLQTIDFENLHKRYFFESSLLIELYHSDAVIIDIPMDAKYGSEVSNLSITKTIFEFPPKLTRAFLKRILYKYFLYDFNIASIYIFTGLPILLFGLVYGLSNFIHFSSVHVPAPTGTVVIPSLMITIGFQLLLSAINFDVNNYPKKDK